jgi:hypothetical protein
MTRSHYNQLLQDAQDSIGVLPNPAGAEYDARAAHDGLALLDERKVAALLGLSVLTLQKWRFLRKGPVYQKIGGKAVRYPVEGLRAWLDSRPGGGDPQEVR